MAFAPYTSALVKIKEFSWRAVMLGLFLGAIFALGNTYLGLKVGMTVSASIPAAVISMAVLRLARKSTILENNMVQTIASAGEAMAAGMIFTLPSLLLLGDNPSFFRMFILAVLGGLLGVLMMVPLRHSLMVEEHGKLPFPEGLACAEILKTRGNTQGKALLTLWGLLIGICSKVAMGIFHLWAEIATWSLGGMKLMLDTTPALLGVGYIIGRRYAFVLFAGGAFAWWGIVPLLKYGLPPSHIEENWALTLRYIGVGAVAASGLLSLIRLIPLLHRSLKGQMGTLITDLFHHEGKARTSLDLPLFWVIGATFLLLIFGWLIPQVGLNAFSLLLVLLLGFFFVALTSVTVGIVGSSSNPASGMILSTLLIATLLFSWLGWTEKMYLLMAMSMGCVIGTAITMAGATSQDLKTGMLLGATPRLQQVATLLGVFIPAAMIAITLSLLHRTYTFGSEELPAPQAMLMALVVEGVIEGNLPLPLVIVGAIFALGVELLGVRSLPFALGLYLPLPTTTAIGIGGAMSHFFKGEGVLVGSGLIAGDALTGIAIALLTLTGIISSQTVPFAYPTLIAYSVLLVLFGWLVARRQKS
ncbi:MAG: oligopeptide transporter, OPT family [Verrucomicrobia bacterium]|nr:oligopeptide transporter, OPT family [Verrucomicrobiota bacterium]